MRRGMALVLVLVALTVVVTAVTGGLLCVQHSEAASLTAGDDQVLWQGRAAGELLVRSWVHRYQGQAVFTTTESQGVTIVADRWHTPSGDGGLVVVLYDGLAGVPACEAGIGLPLHRALPPAAIAVVIPRMERPHPGEASDCLERITGISGRLFPRAPALPEEAWVEVGTATEPELVQPFELDAPRSDNVTSQAIAVGLSPHSDGRINVNTAPEAILRAACIVIGRQDLEQILGARRNRRFTAVAPPPITAMGSESVIIRTVGTPATPKTDAGLPEPVAGQGILLVDHSDCWSALIQVTWRGRSRSWWVVLDGRSPTVQRVQCHDADR